MSDVNPFILGSKGQGQESQKQCRRGSLYSCECWLVLIILAVTLDLSGDLIVTQS